jgi:hypothetical protein
LRHDHLIERSLFRCGCLQSWRVFLQHKPHCAEARSRQRTFVGFRRMARTRQLRTICVLCIDEAELGNNSGSGWGAPSAAAPHRHDSFNSASGFPRAQKICHADRQHVELMAQRNRAAFGPKHDTHLRVLARFECTPMRLCGVRHLNRLQFARMQWAHRHGAAGRGPLQP